MSSLVVVFVAIAVIGWTNKVESSPVQTLDLRKILELVQQHRLNTEPSKPPTLQLRIMSSDSDSDDSLTDSDESDDSDKKRFASIKKDEIIDLLQTAAKTKSNNIRLLNNKAKKNYRQNTDKADDLENQQIAKQRIIDLIETAAKEKTNINHLTNSKAKQNYGQITVKSDDLDNKRLEKERIIDLIETAAKGKPKINLNGSNVKKNYGQITVKADDLDNKRLEKESIIDLIEIAAKGKPKINRLTSSNVKKNYGQITVKSDDLNNKRLERERIIDLIETAAKEKTKINRLTNSNVKKNYGQITFISDDLDNKRLEREGIIDLLKSVANSENNGNVRKLTRKGKTNIKDNGQESYLVKLFSKLYDEEERKKKPKNKLIPNRLTPTVTMDDVKKYYEKQNNNQVEMSKDNEVTGLEDYSKIYIVLNPQAVQNSKNKNALNDLVSKVLSLSSLTSKRVPEIKKMPRRYKGFLVDDNLQLRRFRSLSGDLNDDDKKIDPVAASLSKITAVPV